MRQMIFSGAVVLVFLLTGCRENPFTGKKTLALVPNDNLIAESFVAYDAFIAKNGGAVVTGTEEARMVEAVGNKLKGAAETWLGAEGDAEYLNDYQWEYHLVHSDEINAWCMPGGKIVVYTGILPLAQNEAGLAAIMGHELAHALLNHGQQRQSGSILQKIGAFAVAIFASNQDGGTQQIMQTVYGAGSSLLGTLPFSRKHESEADEIGLTLMTIAGYDPDEAVRFWERMSEMSNNGTFDFLSTHPSDIKRIDRIKSQTHTSKILADRIQTEYAAYKKSAGIE